MCDEHIFGLSCAVKLSETSTCRRRIAAANQMIILLLILLALIRAVILVAIIYFILALSFFRTTYRRLWGLFNNERRSRKTRDCRLPATDTF